MTRLGLIGAGRAAAVHAEASRLAAGVELSAIAGATTDSASATRLASLHGVASVSVDQLIDGCDMVVVATPPAAHLELTARCVEAGLTVLVESPQARTIAEAAEISGDRVVAAANLLHAPAIRTALELTGAMNQPHHIQLDVSVPPRDWGVHGSAAFGAGALFDPGAQVLPLALAVGAAPVTEIEATVEVDVRSIDIGARLRLDFANGRRAQIRLAWAGSDATGWLEVASAGGVVGCQLWPVPALEVNGESRPIDGGAHPLAALGFVRQLERLAAVSGGRAQPWPPTSVGSSSVVVAVAAARSFVHGGPVTTSGLPRRASPVEILAER